MIDILLAMNLIAIGILALYVIQNNNILKGGFRQEFFIDPEQLQFMTEQQEQTDGQRVNLKRYVPNVTTFEDVNKILVDVGAFLVLTEDKTLEELGHNPELWRELTESEIEQGKMEG